MRGKRTFTISALLWLSIAPLAAQLDYFPLDTGNQWVYRVTGAAGQDTWSLEVVKWEVLAGRLYYLVRGFPQGDAWLRLDESGTLVAWDPGAQRERVWVKFGAAEGETYPTEIDPCNRTGRMVSRSARYSGPIGEFGVALRIGYPPSCADAGLSEEYYLPYVGLLRRTATTIAGPRTADLIYARLGGITVISEKEIGFGLTLDRAVYVANLMPPIEPGRAVPVMTARLTLRVYQDRPVRLDFPSGQTYDLVIKNEKGDVVYQWSRDKAFTLALRSVPFGPGETNWPIAVPLGARGTPFPEGKYVAEAWLTTIGQRAFSASVGFEIQHTH